jgi:hypothetical protein
MADRLRFIPSELCPGGTTMIVDKGQEPASYDDAPRCRFCRQPHILVLDIAVVESPTTEA